MTVEISVRGSDRPAIVDVADEPLVARYRWYLLNGYVTAAGGRSRVRVKMHRLIAPPPVGLYVDHINRDKLDNRRSNLRAVTFAQSMQNRDKYRHADGTPTVSKYRGVCYSLRGLKRWYARITVGRVRRYLGAFDSEAQAAMVAAAARAKLMTHAID